MKSNIAHRRHWLMLTAAIAFLAVAAVFRLAGIGWSLPYLYHPDEPGYITIVLKMLQTGDLNPHWFQFPSLFFYLSLIVLIPYYLLGVASGVFQSPANVLGPHMVGLGVGSLPFPVVIELPRMLMALAGVLTVLAVFSIAFKRSSSLVAAIVAAVLLALSPASILAAHFFRPDTLMALFVLLAVYFATRLPRIPKLSTYLLAGVMAGLAIAAKYNAWPVVLSIIAGHFLTPRSQRQFKFLIAAGFTCIAALFIASPFLVLDFSNALEGASFEARHYYVLGHAGADGVPSLSWYLGVLLREEPALTVLGLTGFMVGMWRRDRAVWITLAFAGVYFVQMVTAIVYTRLALVSLLPLLAVESASTIELLQSRLAQRKTFRILVIAGVTALVVIQLTQAIQTTRIFTDTDVQTVASQWIVDNLPKGSQVALEGYTPLLSAADYQTFYVGRITEHPLDWYRAQGYDYLVLSDAMYGRYNSDPVKYHQEIADYQPFLEDLPLLKEIHGPYPFKGEAEGIIRVYALQK